MEAVDAIARISQLLLSRRISANVVVGMLLAAGVAALTYKLGPTAFADVVAVGAPSAAPLLVTLLVFGYGLANLINSAIIELGRTLVARRIAARGRLEAAAEAEKKRAQRERERREQVTRRGAGSRMISDSGVFYLCPAD